MKKIVILSFILFATNLFFLSNSCYAKSTAQTREHKVTELLYQLFPEAKTEQSEIHSKYSPTAEGWHFIRWEYIVGSADGSKVGRFANGDTYTDVSKASGEKNNFTLSISRIDKNNKTIASGKATTIWNDPPKYFSPDELPSIQVKRSVQSTWGINEFSISFDMKQINPGYGTSSKINFKTPQGKTHVQTFEGPMKAPKITKGSIGEQKAIILHINGYGFKYYYEWK